MIKFKVSKKNNNKKIVNLIQNTYPSLKQSVIYKTLRKKDILVNGKRIKENICVYENDEIIAYIPDSILTYNLNLNIVYEDENILIINKPSGISVTEDQHLGKTLTTLVQNTYSKAMPCHRLDRNTSGLVIYAKNSESLKILLDKFKNREIEKFYVCLVHGIPKKKTQNLTSYLFKDNKKATVYISDTPQSGYQKIITSYTVLNENNISNTSLLEVKLETGKTHQIRAHLAHIGHPIIGDGKYGINSINKQFKQKTQMLTAYKLKFTFNSDSGILNYLNGKSFEIDYTFKI